MKDPLPMTLLGMPVRIVPNSVMPPVLQISPDFPHCPPEFRRSWNAWALERFGRDNRIMILGFGGRRVVCVTEEVARLIRENVQEWSPPGLSIHARWSARRM